MSTITKTSAFVRKRGVDRDVRSMLQAFGVGDYNASFLVTAMFLMPRTTDPAAQATQFIVQGAQKGLQLLGAPVVGNGMLDAPTLAALRKCSGQYWLDKTWVQIYGDLLDYLEAGKRPEWASDSIKPALGDATSNLSIGALTIGALLLGYALIAK